MLPYSYCGPGFRFENFESCEGTHSTEPLESVLELERSFGGPGGECAAPRTTPPSSAPRSSPTGAPTADPTTSRTATLAPSPSPTSRRTTESPTSKPVSKPTEEPSSLAPTSLPTFTKLTAASVPSPTAASPQKPTPFPSALGFALTTSSASDIIMTSLYSAAVGATIAFLMLL